jgi:hypothetical protein
MSHDNDRWNVEFDKVPVKDLTIEQLAKLLWDVRLNEFDMNVLRVEWRWRHGYLI